MTTDPAWQQPFETLRRKWHEVPVGRGRQTTRELVTYPDPVLLDLWRRHRAEATTGRFYYARGWYHDLYRDVCRGRRLLDVGSGLGYEGVTFAEHGAEVTFLDVVDVNLEVVQRICALLGLHDRTHFLYLRDLDSLAALGREYDIIWCNGSMHHAPFEVVRPEAQELLKHLAPGGRWIQLAYPRARWEREGSLPFSEWGKKTDGDATPWAEWYDLEKVLALLAPRELDVILAFEFHSSDFNWFDLKSLGSSPRSSTENAVQSWFDRAGYALQEDVERLRAQVAAGEAQLAAGEAQLAAHEARMGALAAEAERLRAEVAVARTRLMDVCQSRWRKLGQAIGLAKTPAWEQDYRKP